MFNILKPMIEHCGAHYENFKSLAMVCHGVSLGRYKKENLDTLVLSNGRIECKEAKLLMKNDQLLTITANESDWALLLKFFTFTHFWLENIESQPMDKA